MSREIKYRVYSNCYKKYLDTSGKGIFCEVHHLALKPDGKLYYADIGIDYPGTLSECPTLEWEEDYEDCMVEQFTGLLDRNGKEIYEGDIIKVQYPAANDYFAEVKYEYAGFEPFIIPVGDYDNYLDGDMVEVVGNVHENPELLEAK